MRRTGNAKSSVRGCVIVAKKRGFLQPKGGGPSWYEQRKEAEREYRSARRKEARAERIAGTFDKKKFSESGKSASLQSTEELKQSAEKSRERRETSLKTAVRESRGQRSGDAAHKAASAMFDMTDKADRKRLRDQIGEGNESGDNLIAAEDAFLEDSLDEYMAEGEEGNYFDPDDDEDWALIF